MWVGMRWANGLSFSLIHTYSHTHTHNKKKKKINQVVVLITLHQYFTGMKRKLHSSYDRTVRFYISVYSGRRDCVVVSRGVCVDGASMLPKRR